MVVVDRSFRLTRRHAEQLQTPWYPDTAHRAMAANVRAPAKRGVRLRGLLSGTIGIG